MIITKHTLKKKSPFLGKSVMSCFNTGAIYFSKEAAKLLNAPCKISFDIEKERSICFHDENIGFQIIINRNGFMTFSAPLVRHLQEVFEINYMPKFQIKSTIDKHIFELKLIESCV